jgi:hypothetical protein
LMRAMRIALRRLEQAVILFQRPALKTEEIDGGESDAY